MKYHTIKSERFNLRCRGSYATYPLYNHAGDKLGHFEAYGQDVKRHLEYFSINGLNSSVKLLEIVNQ